VKHGPFPGWEGILVYKKNAARLVVSLEQIMQSVSLEFDGVDIEPAIATKLDLSRAASYCLQPGYIELVLAEEEGSIDRAAKRLGILRSSLYTKIKLKEIERPAAGRDLTAAD
jgi:DNA-binding NtrC family response regulator